MQAYQEQFADCAECRYCERDIPMEALDSHQKDCIANLQHDKNKNQEIENITKEFEMMKAPVKKNKYHEQIRKNNKKHNPQKKQEIKQSSSQEEIKKQYLKQKQSVSYEEKIIQKQQMSDRSTVLIPCQNCGKQLLFQQISNHQQSCLSFPKILYANCHFCGQAYPQNNLNRHIRQCPIKLELERQTQQFNRKMQMQQNKYVKPKKLAATAYLPYTNLTLSFNEAKKQNPIQRSPFNVSKKIQQSKKEGTIVSRQPIRYVKKVQRSNLKVQTTQCAICFVGIQRMNQIYSLKCGHKFHKGCLDPWLKSSDKCPMCKKVAETN